MVIKWHDILSKPKSAELLLVAKYPNGLSLYIDSNNLIHLMAWHSKIAKDYL